MADVKVYFLGDEHSVPSELREFVGYLNKFGEMRNDIMELLISQMKREEYTDGDDEDFDYFKTPLTKIGQNVIIMLSEKGIFDITLNDVVYLNPGYIQLHTVCQETTQEMGDIDLTANRKHDICREEVYSSAASDIVGSGMSIWTTSPVTALLYSAVESSILNSQAKKADRECAKTIAILSKSINDSREEDRSELLVKKYYPGVAEALDRFVCELMGIYVSELERHNIFAYSLVKEYNMQRSSDILNNLNLVADKKGVLKQAFICCPYNPDVYKAVLDNGLIDAGTFETAKYFMQDDFLFESVEEYCQQNYDNKDKIANVVKILAWYKGEDESQAWNILESEKKIREDKEYEELHHIECMKSDLRSELFNKLAEIDNQQKPTPRPYIEHLLGKKKRDGKFVSLCLTVVLCLLLSVFLWHQGFDDYFVIPLAIGLLCMLIVILLLIVALLDYSADCKKIENWDIEQRDKKAQLREQYSKYGQNIEKYGQREKP